MKLLMDKRAEQTEQLKARLKQELQKARGLQGSVLSLDSVSDDLPESHRANANGVESHSAGELLERNENAVVKSGPSVEMRPRCTMGTSM